MTYANLANAAKLISPEAYDVLYMSYYFATSFPAYQNAYGPTGYVNASSSTPLSLSSSTFENVSGATAAYAVDKVASAISHVSGLALFNDTSASAEIVISGINVPVTLGGQNVGGFTNRPDAPYYVSPLASDIFITRDASGALQTGEQLETTLSHEFLHAIGLKDVKQSSGLLFTGIENSAQYTIMSYNPHVSMGRFATELQIYDIAAIQAIFGYEDFAYNNVYNEFIETSSSSFSGQNRIFSIWDGGGVDEIDASTTSGAALIDLRPGYFSAIGNATGVVVNSGMSPSLASGFKENVSIAFGAYIENAKGTSGSDLIIGNILSNRLIGGAGNDVIYADGFDAVIHDGGSSGIYDRMVSGGLGATESAPSTIMTYVGDPTAQHDEIIGGSGEDYIHGGRGSDTLVGGSENDVLIGGTGNDVIYGGEENVTGFNRADGVDIADYSEELSGITVNFNATVSTQSLSVIDGQSGNDTLNSIEKVIATTGQDTFNFQGTLPNGLKFEIDGNGGHDIINLGGSSMTGGASLVLSGNGRITNKAGGSGEIILKNYKTEIFGSDYDDSITDRGDGTHIINAGEGDDTITVGGHNGIINGESGNDVIHLGSSSATVQFAVGGGSDVVEFDNDDGDYHLQLLNLNPDDIALIAGGRDIYFSTGTIEEYDGRYEKIYYQFLTVQIKSTGEQITFLENGRNIGPDGNGGAITYNGPGSAKDQGKLDSITFADGTVITQGQIWHYLDHPGDAPISVWYDTWGYRSDFTDDNANDYLEHVNQTYLQAAPIGAPPPPPDDEFDGTPGDDNIKPGYGNDTVEGGQGDDTINESVGDDTYKWAVGDGNDVIVGDGTLSGSNRLELGAGVTASDLQFAVVNNGLGLAISFANVSGSITLDEQLIGQGFGVDQIVFADTTVMTRAQILAAASSEISAATTYQTGTSGNNSMSAYFGNFVIDGGGGNDTITAWTNGSGIYRFANNQGNDKLAHGSGIVRNDTLELTGANSGDISLSRSSDNLVVTITSTGATFTVNDQFAYDGVSVYGINTLKFANGTTWDREYIAGLASGNTAPVADAAVASTIQDAALLHGTLTATDPDVNGWLTFALDDRVDGLVLNRDGSWTFDPSDPAYRSLAADTPLTVTANYHVTDQEGLTSSSTLSITITGTDDLPTLLHTLSNQRVADSASFSYDLSGKFADADGDALTLSAALADGSPLPGWLSFDGEVVSGTAPNGQSGVLDIQITASDGEYSATGAFLLHFGADNDAPVVDHPLPSVDGAVGILVDVLVPLNTFSDAEGDSIMVSATLASGASLPSWLTFSDGRLTGTPPVGSADEYAIKITASDGEASTSSVFTLDIAPYQTILGTADNDYIVLPENAFLVDAGLGNDTLLVSGEGAGIFSFSSGDGHDFIMQSMWGTRDDTLRFTDLLPSDVTLARSADSLTITVTATGDTVGIASQFFEWEDRGVSYVEFADNTVWTRPDLLAFTVI